jgi:copper chaperone CopZ
VRVAVRKLEGVESVDVSLERASADIRLRPGNRVALAQLRQIIRDNGFTSKEATVTALGMPIERGGKPALQLSGSGTVWLMRPDQDARAYTEAGALLASSTKRVVEVTGRITPAASAADPEVIVLQSIRAVPE